MLGDSVEAVFADLYDQLGNPLLQSYQPMTA